MATRAEQQTRYWLTTKGWAAALCVSQSPATTPMQTTTTEPIQEHTDD